MDKQTLIIPRLSEKAYATSESGVYVVDIPASLSKQGVIKVINAQFGVSVVNVRVANVKGKAKRTISASGKRVGRSSGLRSDIKKAYITLKKGDSLPFFKAIEEAEEKEQKTHENIAKAVEKKASKETKQSPKKASEKPAKRSLHLPHLRSGSRGGDK